MIIWDGTRPETFRPIETKRLNSWKESMLASMHARQLTWTLMSWCILLLQALKDRREPSYPLPRAGTMLETTISISSIQDLPSD